jgi:hypothetical protein
VETRDPSPRRLCFLTQSVETIENKGVVFFVSARMCKRVRKSMKTNEGTVVGTEAATRGILSEAGANRNLPLGR